MTTPAVSLVVCGKTDVGRVRKNNEDAFVVQDLRGSPPLYETTAPVTLEVGERGVLLAVSDGMGGEQAGEVASALALQSLRRAISGSTATTAEAALRVSVEVANQRVFDAAHESHRTGMGATLTAVLIHGAYAYVAEIGDSRAYILRGNRFVQLTHDQSYVQLLVDSGALTSEQAENCEYKNVILQAIGTTPSVIVALDRLSLRKRDRILLCSDGLSRMVPDEEIKQIIATSPTLDAACNELVRVANARGGEDNITVVLADIDGEGIPALTDEGRVSLETVQAYTGVPAPASKREPVQPKG